VPERRDQGSIMGATVRFCLVLLAFLAPLGIGTASAEYPVEEVGLRFPDQLGGAQLVRGHRYPQDYLGHSISYARGGLGASIYVYHGGQSNIPDGITGPVIRAQFAKARGDIAAVQRQQNAPEPQLLGERTIDAGGVEFVSASYLYMRQNRDAYSLVALTGFRRHFVKLRVSVWAEGGAAMGSAQIEEFVQSLGRFLAAAGPR